MKKKFICTVCGYIYEGTEAPEKCPICKAPKSKFQELNDPTEGPAFATVHTLGAARMEGATEEMIKDLQRRAVMRDPNMAGATILEAQAEAMKLSLIHI